MCFSDLIGQCAAWASGNAEKVDYRLIYVGAGKNYSKARGHLVLEWKQ